MGIIRNKEFSDDSAATATATANGVSHRASSLCEALLFTTMCIIGLPVEVHIKDGSIYSGIFHTASVEKGYGIILKKARMIKKGTHSANIKKGGLIDTLVVLPGDLVQVVAKGVMLPVDGGFGAAVCNEAGVVSGSTFPFAENGTESAKIHFKSQAGVADPWREEDAYDHLHRTVMAEPQPKLVEASSKNVNGFGSLLVNAQENEAIMPTQLSRTLSDNGASPNAKTFNNYHDDDPTAVIPHNHLNTAKPILDNMSKGNHVSLAHSEMVPPQGSVVNKVKRESKLNPGARIFSPSLANSRASAPPPIAPTMINMPVVPNSFHTQRIPTPQPEVGSRVVAGHPSWTAKFIPYSNLTAVNGANGFHYAQPIAGHTANRVQPLRYGNQYQPVQIGHPFLNPNLQNGVVGVERIGPVFGVHQFNHDIVQGSSGPVTAAFSRALLTPFPARIPKLEGYVHAQVPQISVTPPLITNEQLAFAIPGPVPVSQSNYPPMHPVPILGSNGPFRTKFI